MYDFIILLDNTLSTNRYIANYLQSNIIDQKKQYKSGVVLSIKQTQGKGRNNRYWISDVGGLYFSLAFHISLLPFDYQLLPIYLICNIISVINKLYNLSDNDIKLKWPNDILFDNKKLGGVLTERYEDYIIVGVGINIYNKLDDDIQDTAVNLYDITKIKIDVVSLLFYILEDFSNAYDILLKENKTPVECGNYIRKQYLKYLSTINKYVNAYVNNKVIKGKAINIDHQNRLIIQQSAVNKLLKIHYDDVHHIRHH